ncbi:MAG: hypothetical protein K9I68_02085 [Bacteroidales bacterium]|nr:hypothetical protein [Bacteroidales bacterium]MCF8337041.1 hypothetical protein [Bacteroidales bacterium]
MMLETWYQYGENDENNFLKLYYSTDYASVGDVSTARRNKLSHHITGKLIDKAEIPITRITN